MPWETKQKSGGNHSTTCHLRLKSNMERTYTPLKSSCVPHWTDRLLLLMSIGSLGRSLMNAMVKEQQLHTRGIHRLL